MRLKILVFTSWGNALPHVMDGYTKAFRLLGHEVLSIDMSVFDRQYDKRVRVELAKVMYKAVKDFRPHFAVFYATLGCVSLATDNNNHLLEKMGIPYVSLFYDNPFIYFQHLDSGILESMKNSSIYMAFSSDTFYLDALKKFGFSNLGYLPLATDPDIFYEIDKNHPELTAFRCDISFVGSIDESPSELRRKRREKWKKYPALNKKIDEITDPNRTLTSVKVIEELSHFENQMPWHIYALFCRAVYREADTFLRLAMVKTIDNYRVDVYGGEGWRYLDDSNVRYRGRIDYRKELPLLYNSSLINLNITSPQLRRAINQRIYDVSACGGFVLTDYRTDLEELFGDTVIYYKDRKELRQKVDYYLRHEDERVALAKEAKQKVLKKHTWLHRAKVLIEGVQNSGIV